MKALEQKITTKIDVNGNTVYTQWTGDRPLREAWFQQDAPDGKFTMHPHIRGIGSRSFTKDDVKKILEDGIFVYIGRHQAH